MTDEAKVEPKSEPNVVNQPTDVDKWPQEYIAFVRAATTIHLKHLKDESTAYVAAVTDFRALETEYLKHFEDNSENAFQVRRIIAEYLITTAWFKDEPFETCWQCWNDLVQLGFYHIVREGLETGQFAAFCIEFGQIDIGLSLVDPFLAKVERLRAEPNVPVQAAKYYDQEIASFRDLRARLEAARESAP